MQRHGTVSVSLELNKVDEFVVDGASHWAFSISLLNALGEADLVAAKHVCEIADVETELNFVVRASVSLVDLNIRFREQDLDIDLLHSRLHGGLGARALDSNHVLFTHGVQILDEQVPGLAVECVNNPRLVGE